MRCKEKSPPGHPSPIAKNLSKLEGDQVGHIVFSILLSLIQAVLCSAALWIRTSAGLWVSECRKSRKRKKPTQVQPPLEGAACMDFDEIAVSTWVEVCFTHTYYNKVGSRMIEGRPDGREAKRKPANHVRCTQWAGSLSFYWLLISAITVSGYTP